MYRVLIVDDELAAREMIACLVDWKEIGFEEPDMAKDGRQALEFFRQKSYDIVFTDIEMPFMDGLEMIEEMKREKSGQRFVIISCHESFAYARRALQMGVSEYLIKDLIVFFPFPLLHQLFVYQLFIKRNHIAFNRFCVRFQKLNVRVFPFRFLHFPSAPPLFLLLVSASP